MADRTKIPLSFGGGMDRATGVFEVQPENFLDLRNVYLYRNRLEARKGLAAANTQGDVQSAIRFVVVGNKVSDTEAHLFGFR